MAIPIGNEFPKAPTHGRGPSVAQMTEWSDGQVWLIKHGDDYDCPLTYVRGTLSSYASRNNLKLKTTTKGQPTGSILVQFLPKESS